MSDDPVAAGRVAAGEIREQNALLNVKRLLIAIRVLEAVYRRYMPSYVSPIDHVFVEEILSEDDA